jgi:excisionase family DNA binding protein
MLPGSCRPADFYQVGVFTVEPAADTSDLRGCLGEIAPSGELDWHAEVVQVGRGGRWREWGATFLVVYRRITPPENPRAVGDEERDQTLRLAELVLAPLVIQTTGPVRLTSRGYLNCAGDGKELLRQYYPRWIGRTPGLIGYGAVDYAVLRRHPEALAAVRYYGYGIDARERGHLADACIDYYRALECIFGSTKQKKRFEAHSRSECVRLGLRVDDVWWLMREVRGKYALAHTLAKVRPRRKIQPDPPRDIERRAQSITQTAIRKYIAKLPPIDREEERGRAIRYHGIGSVPPPLPTPHEVLHTLLERRAAVGESEQLEGYWTVAEAASRSGLSAATIRRAARSGDIRAARAGRTWLIVPESLEIYSAHRWPDRMAATTAPGVCITPDYAAEKFGIPRGRILKLLGSGKVAGYRSPVEPQEWLVSIESLKTYLEGRRKVAARGKSAARDAQERA